MHPFKKYLLELDTFLFALLKGDSVPTEIKDLIAISFRRVVSDCFPDIRKKYFAVLIDKTLCVL